MTTAEIEVATTSVAKKTWSCPATFCRQVLSAAF